MVRVRDYGEGDVEASWGVSILGQKRRRTERGKSKDRPKNIERCNRRARAELRRKCMAAGLDHLLTLTYRENITDLIEARSDFDRFIRKIHEHDADFKYVVVEEIQKRGAIHFHLGVKGFQNVFLLRSIWRSVVGEGNVDVNYIKSKKGYRWSKARLAMYLAKYIGKDMESELNKKRFRSSQGITIPEKVYYLPFKMSARDYVLELVKSLGGKVGFVWNSEEGDGLFGWACSWG